MHEFSEFLSKRAMMNLGGLPSDFKLGALQQARVLGVVDKRAILLVKGRALGVPVAGGCRS